MGSQGGNQTCDPQIRGQTLYLCRTTTFSNAMESCGLLDPIPATFKGKLWYILNRTPQHHKATVPKKPCICRGRACKLHTKKTQSVMIPPPVSIWEKLTGIQQNPSNVTVFLKQALSSYMHMASSSHQFPGLVFASVFRSQIIPSSVPAPEIILGLPTCPPLPAPDALFWIKN